jgi:site-specific DNA recombinase
MKKPKKAIIYCRVSTTYQAKEGISLDNQLDKCKKYLAVDDYEVLRSFREEGKSGRTEWRDEYQSMMNYIRENKNEIGAVCFYSLSRLGRNVKLVLDTITELDEYGISVLSVNERLDTSNAYGRFALVIISALAELESAQTAERVFDNMHFSVQNFGTWQGSRYYPYGYKPSEKVDDKGNRPLEIVKEEAEQVKQIFDYYTKGLDGDIDVGTFKIAKKLNELGQRYLRDNSEWHGKRVLDIIKNAHFYAGWYYWNKTGTKNKYVEIKNEFGTVRQPVMSKRSKSFKPEKETYIKPREEWAIGKGKQDAIISESVWKVAEAKYEKRRNKNENLDTTRQPKHYLTGILVCPSCGHRMLASSNKRFSKKNGEIQEVYYRCQKASAGQSCKHNVMNEKYLLPIVKKAFFAYYPLLIKQKIEKTLIAQVFANSNLRSEKYDEIVGLQNQIENILELAERETELFRKGLIFEQNLIKKKKQYEREISDLEKKIEKIKEDNKEMLVSESEIESLKHIIHNFSDAEEYFNSLDKLTQRNLLNEVVIKLEVDKKVGIKGKDSIKVRRIIINDEIRSIANDELQEIWQDPSLAQSFLKLNAEIMNDAKMDMFSIINTARPSQLIEQLEKEYNVIFYNRDTDKYSINLTTTNQIEQLNPEDSDYLDKVKEIIQKHNLNGVLDHYLENLEKLKARE